MSCSCVIIRLLSVCTLGCTAATIHNWLCELIDGLIVFNIIDRLIICNKCIFFIHYYYYFYLWVCNRFFLFVLLCKNRLEYNWILDCASNVHTDTQNYYYYDFFVCININEKNLSFYCPTHNLHEWRDLQWFTESGMSIGSSYYYLLLLELCLFVILLVK